MPLWPNSQLQSPNTSCHSPSTKSSAHLTGGIEVVVVAVAGMGVSEDRDERYYVAPRLHFTRCIILVLSVC